MPGRRPRGNLHLLGFPETRCSAGELWSCLLERVFLADNEVLRTILQHGPLARRLLRAVGEEDSPARLHEVYRQLCDCLDEASLFTEA